MSTQKYAVVSSEGGTAGGHATFPRNILTRHLCISGLCASAVLAVVCLGVGLAYYDKAQDESQGWISLSMSRTLKEILPLLINMLVTVLTESTGFIHATSLRWALGNRMTFTSNLRLFSRARGRLAFGRTSNLLNAGFLVLSYGATSLILVGVPPAKICHTPELQFNGPTCDDTDNLVYFCPGALIALSIGLAGNAALTTWQLTTVTIPTWSSSPIDIVWASFSIGQRRRIDNRCMVSVHESTSVTGPRTPKPQQQSAWSAHREVRSIFIYLWILVVAVLIWFGGLAGGIEHAFRKCENNSSYICSVYSGTSWSLLPDLGGITSLAQINTVHNSPGDSESPDFTNNEGFAVACLLILAFQSVLTMGLHCAELLVNMSRDEDVWRETSSRKGLVPRSALFTVARSWKCVLLLALKPFVHWLFGLGMAFYFGWGIFMRPPQLLYLSLALIVLAALGTFVCFTRPQGPQPATFGHIQTLLDLIDEWHEHMFWGHKGRGVDGICHAGTAKFELEKVIMEEEYAAS